MRILGLESATAVCAAAIISDGKLVAEKTLDAPHVHSEKMIPLIQRVLQGAGCSIGELDGIAVSIGPGSFTGLRIGLSVAKGLALANDKPLLAISTLEALAWRVVDQQLVQNGDLVASLIDARRAEVYAAVYRWNGIQLACQLAERAISVGELRIHLDDADRIVLMGDGAEKFLNQGVAGGEKGDDRYFTPPRSTRVCSAAAVGMLGEKKLMRGEIAELFSLEPMYVKDFHTLIVSQHAGV